MKWFRDRRERSLARRQFIFKCQKILAFQQLAGEIYNAGIAAASSGGGGAPSPGFARSYTRMANPATIRDHVVPALERKIEIVALMQAAVEDSDHLEDEASRSVNYWMSRMVAAISTRADAQLSNTLAFVDGAPESDMQVIDKKEMEAMDTATQELNDLIINKAKLHGDEFATINCEAFNAVRTHEGQEPLRFDEWAERYTALLRGERVWFFDVHSDHPPAHHRVLYGCGRRQDNRHAAANRP
ncbi:MAG: hypothetical protein O2826_11690 [Chloroflexi bacterium]|nr:hypothetical protein [Chloroflexota bacterium]